MSRSARKPDGHFCFCHRSSFYTSRMIAYGAQRMQYVSNSRPIFTEYFARGLRHCEGNAGNASRAMRH